MAWVEEGGGGREPGWLKVGYLLGKKEGWEISTCLVNIREGIVSDTELCGAGQNGSAQACVPATANTVLQSHKAVSAYLESEQILPSGCARQHGPHQHHVEGGRRSHR